VNRFLCNHLRAMKTEGKRQGIEVPAPDLTRILTGLPAPPFHYTSDPHKRKPPMSEKSRKAAREEEPHTRKPGKS